jgi:hypothetical protein
MRPYVDDNVIEALDEYAVNATGKSGPSPSEYTQGSVPMDSLPSSWWNFFIGKLTKNVQRTAHGVQDIYAEMTAVLTEAGITPSATVHGQLLDGIKKVGGDQVKVITASASPDMNVVGYEYIIVGPSVTTGTVTITIPAASSVVLGSKFKGVRIGSVAGTGATVQVNASATSYMPQDPILLHPGEAMTFDLRSTSTGTFKWFMSSGGGGTYAGDVSKVRGSLARYSQQGTLRTATPTEPYDAINKQYYDAQVLGRQIWLAAVNTHAELPASGDIPDYDPTANYLCRVMHDDGDPPQNGVWQLIAHSDEWTLFSDNADFIDEAELEEAINQEVSDRDEAISEAIDTEIENRNAAITAAIEQEVLDRDEAITTAISSKQDTLVGSGTGQNLKTVGGNNLLGTGDISFPAGALSDFTFIIDSNEALSKWLTNAEGENYRSVYVGPGQYIASGITGYLNQNTIQMVGHNTIPYVPSSGSILPTRSSIRLSNCSMGASLSAPWAVYLTNPMISMCGVGWTLDSSTVVYLRGSVDTTGINAIKTYIWPVYRIESCSFVLSGIQVNATSITDQSALIVFIGAVSFASDLTYNNVSAASIYNVYLRMSSNIGLAPSGAYTYLIRARVCEHSYINGNGAFDSGAVALGVCVYGVESFQKNRIYLSSSNLSYQLNIVNGVSSSNAIASDNYIYVNSLSTSFISGGAVLRSFHTCTNNTINQAGSSPSALTSIITCYNVRGNNVYNLSSAYAGPTSTSALPSGVLNGTATYAYNTTKA